MNPQTPQNTLELQNSGFNDGSPRQVPNVFQQNGKIQFTDNFLKNYLAKNDFHSNEDDEVDAGEISDSYDDASFDDGQVQTFSDFNDFSDSKSDDFFNSPRSDNNLADPVKEWQSVIEFEVDRTESFKIIFSATLNELVLFTIFSLLLIVALVNFKSKKSGKEADGEMITSVVRHGGCPYKADKMDVQQKFVDLIRPVYKEHVITVVPEEKEKEKLEDVISKCGGLV